MRPNKVIILIVIFLSLNQLRGEEGKKLKKVTETKINKESIDPSLTSPLNSPGVKFVFEGTREKKFVKALFGIQEKNTTITLKFRGPIGEKDTKANLVSLDGLANSVVCEIGLVQFLWKPEYKGFDHKAFANFLKELMVKFPEKAEEIEEIDSYQDLPIDAQKYLDEKIIDWGVAHLIGLNFQIGGEKFKYFDSTNLDVTKASKTNYAIKATYGIFIPQNDLIFSVNYTHTVSYRTGEKRMIYKPLEEFENVFESMELPLGAPVKNTSEIISFEYRQFFGNTFAINPKYCYDFKNKVSGIELPLYFLQSKDKGLNGGVSLGWRSDTKEWSASIFVGNVLDLFF